MDRHVFRSSWKFLETKIGQNSPTYIWLPDSRCAVVDLEDDIAVFDVVLLEVDHEHLVGDHGVVGLELEEARVCRRVDVVLALHGRRVNLPYLVTLAVVRHHICGNIIKYIKVLFTRNILGRFCQRHFLSFYRPQ